MKNKVSKIHLVWLGVGCVAVVIIFIGLRHKNFSEIMRYLQYNKNVQSTGIPRALVAQATGNKISEEHGVWSQEIDSLGAAPAYAAFKQTYEKSDFNLQHTYVHLFGEILYEKLGLQGFSVCDNAFNFGCYHGFLAKAIEQEGVGVIHNLDNQCIEKWGTKELACQHGIGHGVLAYVTEKKLSQALEICSGLTFQGPIGGCSSGVFMENNFRTLSTANGLQSIVRTATENLYSPCSEIDDRFRPGCYYEQPQWWVQIVHGNYSEIGKLCNALKDMEQKQACFRGFGKSVGILTSYNVQESVALCQKMPTNQARSWCRETASWSFFELPQFRKLAPHVCKGLELDSVERCAKLEEEK